MQFLVQVCRFIAYIRTINLGYWTLHYYDVFIFKRPKLKNLVAPLWAPLKNAKLMKKFRFSKGKIVFFHLCFANWTYQRY